MTRGFTIGIDLGTTNSVVAAPFGDAVDVLPNEAGRRKTPSVVAFTDEETLVGRDARNQSASNPEYTVHAIKRDMGDPDVAVADRRGREYTPKEISALILSKLKRTAAERLGGPVERAVITVPAYFGNRQREATKQAGRIAGLEVERLLNEPTAACLAYGLDDGGDDTILVYDLGGGTFDVSVVDIADGIVEVLATDGDTALGGDDWDARLVDVLVDRVRSETGRSPDGDVEVMERLWDAARQAKHDLSTQRSTTVSVPFLYHDEGYDLETTVERAGFERGTRDLLDRTLDICETALGEAGLSVADLDDVLLVGGSTRMPQVTDGLADRFGIDPTKRIDADMAVALGAAAQAGVMSDPTDLPATADGSNGALSTGRGQAGPDDVVLLDVTPKTLGVGARLGGRDNQLSRLIPKNTPIPERIENTYTTVADNQEVVTIKVYQGENQVASENELLDTFSLRGIPPAPAGQQDIDVTFELDENGILHVEAENADASVSESITIESAVGTSDRELDRMRRDLPDVV